MERQSPRTLVAFIDFDFDDRASMIQTVPQLLGALAAHLEANPPRPGGPDDQPMRSGIRLEHPVHDKVVAGFVILYPGDCDAP